MLSHTHVYLKRIIPPSCRCMSTSVSATPSASAGKAILHEKQLNNGVTVLARDAYVEVAVSSGSRHERENEKGAAHLLSVAAFAGTQNRDGLRLMREIENYGFSVGVEAGREKTVYSIRSVPEFASDAAAILTEVILSPPKHSYLIKERMPVAEYDYHLRQSSPQLALTEMLYEAAYGEGTPMGSSCYATKLSKLHMDDVLAFRNRHFTSPNLTVAADGMSLAELEAIGTAFGEGEYKAITESPYCGGVVRRAVDFNGQIHAALAFPAAHGANGKAYAVLHTILESRLAAKTKGDNKGCLKSFHIQNSDSGLVGCYTATQSKQSTEDLLALTINELKEIASKVNASAAKTKLSLLSASALDGGDAAATLLLSAASQGIPLSQIGNYSDVTNEEVSAAAAAILKSTPSYAVLGNTFGVQPYHSVCSMMR